MILWYGGHLGGHFEFHLFCPWSRLTDLHRTEYGGSDLWHVRRWFGCCIRDCWRRCRRSRVDPCGWRSWYWARRASASRCVKSPRHPGWLRTRWVRRPGCCHPVESRWRVVQASPSQCTAAERRRPPSASPIDCPCRRRLVSLLQHAAILAIFIFNISHLTIFANGTVTQ